ncbi:MAG: alpha/beta hydrolase [Bacteroidota bacterium]
MRTETIICQTDKNQVPFETMGNGGPVIHFAHANGYPPGSYRQLFEEFSSDFQIVAMHQRPLWKNSRPKKLNSWQLIADDMIQFLDGQGLKNIIGMGHSMGGVVSVMAAIKRPDLFRQLVLIDPVIFNSPIIKMVGWLPQPWRKKVIPIAKLSSKRRDEWDSQQAVFDSFRTKKVYRSFSDEALWDFIKSAIVPNGAGKVTLAYPKAWETQVYITAPAYLGPLKKVETPILAVKGEYSNVITAEVWSDWQAAQPHNHFLEYPNSGHLVPMEYPKEVADWVKQYL